MKLRVMMKALLEQSLLLIIVHGFGKERCTVKKFA
jgi:hypothetical protein